MRDYGEIVKRLREHNGWALNETLDQAADAIEELQKRVELEYQSGFADGQISANRKKNKWISAEDALPEVDQPVMICAFGKSVGEGVYRGHDGFHHVWKMYASSGTYWDDEVTHYMPLPEPPEEDDK